MTLAELSSLINSGVKFTPDQMKEANQLMMPLLTGKVPPSEKDTYGTDAASYIQNLSAALNTAANTAGGKQFFNDMSRQKNADRFVQRLKPMANSLLQGADIGVALSQIKQSNKYLKNLVQPGIPAAPRVDPALNSALAKSQQGVINSEQVLAPLKQQAAAGFRTDVNTAANTSGGQGSIYNAGVQAANLRRTRAMAQAPAILQQSKLQNQQMVNDLAQQRNYSNLQNYQNQLWGTDMANQRYMTQAQNAALLGVTGRTNLRNVFQTLPQNLLYSAGYMANPSGISQRPVDQIANNTDPISAYSDQVNSSLARNLQRIQNMAPSSYTPNLFSGNVSHTLGVNYTNRTPYNPFGG